MALWSKTDEAAGKPKYLNTDEKALTFGISVAEAQDANNTAKGIKTPGWTRVQQYIDAQGNQRNKIETLVAFASDLSGDADTLELTPVISIDVQPAPQTVTEPTGATFTVTASNTNTSTLSYQWQIDDGALGNWTDVTGATASSYTIDPTANATDDGFSYRVIVSGTNGAVAVTSNAALLTVNP